MVAFKVATLSAAEAEVILRASKARRLVAASASRATKGRWSCSVSEDDDGLIQSAHGPDLTRPLI